MQKPSENQEVPLSPTIANQMPKESKLDFARKMVSPSMAFKKESKQGPELGLDKTEDIINKNLNVSVAVSIPPAPLEQLQGSNDHS